MKNIGYLAQDISILHRQYYRDTRPAFNELKLNPTAACILLTIGDYGEMTQNKVARLLVVDKGLATREINKMVKLAYVTKADGAAKTKILRLTPVGQRVVQRIQTIRTTWWQDKFAQTGISADSPLVGAIETIVTSLTTPDQ